MGDSNSVPVRFFEELDWFKSPAGLRIHQEDNYRSCRLGFLSTLLALFFSYIFINECTKLITFETIKCSSVTSRKHSAETSGKIPMISVCLDFLPIQEFKQMFQFKMQVYKEGKLFQQVGMRPCESYQWKLLGEDYQKQFTQYELGTMFCPSTDQGFNISQTFRSDTLDYVTITMKACNPINNPLCNPNLISEYLAARTKFGGSAQVWVYVLDQVLNPEKKNPVSYFINIDSKTQLTQKFGGAIAIQYQTFRIESDASMLPYENIEKVEGNLVDQVRSYPIQYNNGKTDRLIVISLSMNQKYEIINCKYGKFDEVLSYAGGLFSLIITFLSFFFTNFNKYRYEIYVGNLVQSRKNEKENEKEQEKEQEKETKLSLWLYMKYSIYDWINLLFKRKKWGPFWNDCKKIDQKRNVGINQLQVDSLLTRIINSEKKARYLIRMRRIAVSQNIDENELLNYYDQFSEEGSIQKNENQGQMSEQIINNEMSPVQNKIVDRLSTIQQKERNLAYMFMPKRMIERVKKLVVLRMRPQLSGKIK